MAMVNHLSEQSEDCPEWLIQEDYSLTNFFGNRTVCYPGSGAGDWDADGTPIEVFNRSHSAHCYFFVDQAYSRATIMEDIGSLPSGYQLVCEKEYFAEDLGRECTGDLSEIAVRLIESSPISDHWEREYFHANFLDNGLLPFLDGREERRREFRLPADSESAAHLLVFQRKPDYGEDHGANRFAVFLLGMEARTAYCWFYGRMFPNRRPFAIWLLNCMGDQAGGDGGFTDPQGRLYQAAEQYGLPEFLVSYSPIGNDHLLWHGYSRVNNADYFGGDGRDYSLWRKSG